jgi:NAD-dependent histone deacetylase SIR2
MESSDDTAYYAFLQIGIARELVKRSKLPQYNTLKDVAKLLQESKNIIVLTGAGVSGIFSRKKQV